MMTALILFFDEDPSASWAWVAGKDSGTVDTIAEKTALTARGTQPAIVILPGQQIRIFARDLPKLKDRDRLSAAGYAVEDQLGSGLGGQHIVTSDAGADTFIGVVSASYMQSVKTALDAAGIHSARWFADYNVLRAEGVRQFQNRLISGGGDVDQSYSIDRDWDDGTFADALTLSPIEFVEAMKLDGAVNFRQGSFARRRKAADVKGLGRIAALALACCAGALLWQAGTTRALNKQTATLKIETAAMYKQATGEAAPSNPALAAARKQKEGKGSQADFLSLSAGLFSITAQVDGVMIESVQYDARKNNLTLQILYPDFNAASTIETIAQTSGYQFEAGGVREQGGALRGEAVLLAAGTAR